MTDLAELMSTMQHLGVRVLDYTAPDGRHIVLRGPEPVAAATTGQPEPLPQVPAPSAAAPPLQLTASMHGVFYMAPAPGEPPFVKPGDMVEEGQPIGILEAMKTLTRLEADYRCRILSVLVKDAAIIEPGTPLFSVEKRDD
ncbi:acetyl-CoA carboxylase biotin carboxyl carrier protein subunit [Komagataeibacter xylinus]|uniref:Biotin carboxyl carrier protein of acetyl-CoA carboxylase n=2 Tax=Komagataeibacter xylinus TaxID=28448 RepID=A0A857FS50_KOMXY|nr:acetyl-CoA carboxylase biotin carboxyl carrier protein subunit [Komagataeibacter xylinus]